MVYALEDKLGMGPGKHTEGTKEVNNYYIAPPPNSFFTYTSSRNTSLLYGQGSKFAEIAMYGRFAGSWSWSFILDYEYIEPLYLAFEKVTYDEYVGDSKPAKVKFEKSVSGRPKPFCARVRTLNTPAGGTNNDTVLLKGCIVRDMSFSRAGAGSQVQVQMSGFYVDEEMALDQVEEPVTDYQSYDGDPVEYACLIIDGEEVAYTEQISISFSNNTAQGYSGCSPFAQYFSEGYFDIRFGTVAYSNEPTRYKTRTYSGGKDNTHRKPMGKDLHPIDEVKIKCYTYSDHNLESDANLTGYDKPIYATDEGTGAETLVKSGVDNSAKTITFTMQGVVIKSYTSEKGDGQKLMDSISSVEVVKGYIEVENFVNPGVIDLKIGGKHPLKSTSFTAANPPYPA